MLSQPAPGKRHADAVAAALPKRAGRRLDPHGRAIFGMSRAFAVKLPEPLDVVERDRELTIRFVLGARLFHATEMEQRIKQHRGMAVGEHEAISIGPAWIVGIEAQKALPKRVDHRRQRHGRAGMSGFGLLHGVHRECADGIYAKLIKSSRLRCDRGFNGLNRRGFGFCWHWVASRDFCGSSALYAWARPPQCIMHRAAPM